MFPSPQTPSPVIPGPVVPRPVIRRSVIPAKAGIHLDFRFRTDGNLDPGFRQDDDAGADALPCQPSP